MNLTDLSTAFSMTMIAGLSTGIGSLIAFISKKANTKFLSTALGLSAGVMIYISFMELIPESVRQLQYSFSQKQAQTLMLLAFFAGIGLIALIDYLVPEDENPHEIHANDTIEKRKNLKRTGIMLALAIGIHNFPEGLAAFSAALSNPGIVIPIIFAIAIHNIPEGIAVSVPIYHATNSRKKAFWFSFLSGMAEPLGALIGILFLLPFWSPALNALLMAFVSGIMIYISFDELLPDTERYGHHHYGVMGVILGMAIMATSLLLL